jgi:hypothetical protein
MSKIEWTDISRNPVKGKCPTACPYCYARAMYDDNKWDPTIRFRPEVLDDIPRRPCRVFVGSMIELFLFPQWLPEIFDRCQQYPGHTFIFLTKQPQELPRWSPFPDNFDIGVSATTEEQYFDALKYLGAVRAASKFISFEPLLEPVIQPGKPYFQLDHPERRMGEGSMMASKGIGGVIIGAMTGRKGRLVQLQVERYPELRLERLDAVSRKWTLLPRLEGVRDIVVAADAVDIPVFLKDNLYKLLMERPIEDHDLYWEDMSTLRQKLPRRMVRV